MSLRDISKITLILLVIHISFFSISIAYILKNIYQQKIADRVHYATSVANSVKTHLEYEKDNALKMKNSCQVLEEKLNSREIAFYFFQFGSLTCSGPKEYSEANFRFDQTDKLIDSGISDYYYKAYNFYQAKYVIGVQLVGKKEFLSYLISDSAMQADIAIEILKMFVSFFLTNYLVIGLFLDEIKDDFRSSNKRLTKFQSIFLKIFSMFKVSDLLRIQKASKSVLLQNDTLESERKIYTKALTTKMLEEIKEKKGKIPYSFDAVIVRVDLNYFTKMFFSSPNEKMIQLISHYSEMSFELLERYNGLLYQFVGDEVVVAFQDTASEDRYSLAISFIRDFFSEFSDFKFDMGDGVQRSFTIKASLANSKTTFYQLPFGYFYNGENLISSQRVLSMIDIKDHNVMSCLKADSVKINNFVDGAYEEKEVLLKNFPQASELQLFDKFKPIDYFYTKKSMQIKYFRSDNAIIFFLQNILNSDQATQKYLLEVLFLIKPHNLKSAVVDKWKHGIYELSSAISSKDTERIKFLSTFIALAKNLIPKDNWNYELTNALIAIPQNLDLRLNANIIEILGDKLSFEQLANYWAKLGATDLKGSYRPAGNLLLLRAFHKLDDKVVKDILAMLSSNDTLMQHTGVYVAIEVIKFYRKNNPAELEISNETQKIIAILNKFKSGQGTNLSARLSDLLAEV